MKSWPFYRYRVSVKVEVLGTFERDVRAHSAQQAAAVVVGDMGDQGPWGGRSLQLDPWLHNQAISVTVECLELDKVEAEQTIDLDPKIWTLYEGQSAKGETGGSIPGSAPPWTPSLDEKIRRAAADPPVVTKAGGSRPCGGDYTQPGSPHYQQGCTADRCLIRELGRPLVERLADELAWWINWAKDADSVPRRSFDAARRAGTALIGEVDPRRVGAETVCPACLQPFAESLVHCRRASDPELAPRVKAWHDRQPRTAVCSHPCPMVCAQEHCGADVAPVLRKPGT